MTARLFYFCVNKHCILVPVQPGIHRNPIKYSLVRLFAFHTQFFVLFVGCFSVFFFSFLVYGCAAFTALIYVL